MTLFNRALAFALWLGATTLTAQPKVVRLGEIEKILKSKSEEIQVLNFWATWCGPCVKELPLIEEIGKSRNDVHITLVSMDLELDPNPEKVHRFVKMKELKSTVLILDERDPNSWINKIDKNWEGSLPATIVVNTKSGKRAFAGKALKEGELENMIESVK